jgi:hypothetical protein
MKQFQFKTRSDFKMSDQIQGQGAGRSKKRSPPHILADEHLSEACNPPRILADHWALVRRRRIETTSNRKMQNGRRRKK